MLMMSFSWACRCKHFENVIFIIPKFTINKTSEIEIDSHFNSDKHLHRGRQNICGTGCSIFVLNFVSRQI